MKANVKKIIIASVIVLFLIVGIIFGVYKIFKDENDLTILEKTWINNNKNSVYTISVPNDINVFGSSGNGVFFDFVNSLDEDMELKLNSSIYSLQTGNDTFGFKVGTSFDKRDLLLFTDYYVLVNKELSSLTSLKQIGDKTVGLLSKDVSYITNYYEINGNIKTYGTKDELLNGLDGDEVSYIIVPRIEYLNVINSKNYNIAHFFNDAKVYFYLHLGSDDTLNSIIKKYYNKWIVSDFKDSYKKNLYSMFVESLNLTDVEIDAMTDKNYTFKYVVYQPYELLSGGKFTGIVSNYLKSFSEFSGVDFTYKSLNDYNSLKKEINNKNLDLFFTNYNYTNGYQAVNVNLNIDYYLVGKRDLKINIDSLKSFNDEVYVLENSTLYSYLSGFNNITTKTYKNINEAKKLINKGHVVMVDKLYYDSYLVDNLNNTTIFLSDTITDINYNFYYKNGSDSFYKLFKSYVNSLNPDEIVTDGLVEYYKTYKTGSRTVSIARYLIIVILVFLLIVFWLIRNKKRIVLNTKVKNNEKIRYVDMLTSLKNRNYLNDRLEIWNQNTIYPQAVIVLDLNHVKYLNDTFGHEEGDKQIKAAANALFKTQLENTELIRTDGNEFMVYMVGYTEKQVISYIKKLVKEFKKLPYDYGVAVGFSMIEDDLKLIEDAFNEATIQMRENKAKFEDENEK